MAELAAPRSPIQIVWFKKDVRLHDHGPLAQAILEGLPTVLLYVFEPSLRSLPESDDRHWRFILQGVKHLHSDLKRNGHSLLVVEGEVLDILDYLHSTTRIAKIYSYEETGLEATYRRDQAVGQWCVARGVDWQEIERDGVKRALLDRRNWQERWQSYMDGAEYEVDLSRLQSVDLTPIPDRLRVKLTPEILKTEPRFQIGGEDKALSLLHSFVSERASGYLRNLARPEYSQSTCSRLSPYMAHGQVSARRVFQQTKRVRERLGKNIDQFHNRMWWRCHYIQKLETEYQIEKEHINRGFDQIHKPFSSTYFERWSTGQTGFPMIDAAMRCVNHTGYLNFRMRAMLATFWAFTLWQDWRPGATYLARMFLDFDPGIHYPQFQMQAGMTGYHPLRIFNPIVQAKKYDDYGVFIKKWVPELANIPAPMTSTPWLLSPMEQSFYRCQIGKDYPLPIVDYQAATERAKTIYWEYRKQKKVREQLPSVWKKHSLPKDIVGYTQEFFAGKEILVTESIMYDPTKEPATGPPKTNFEG
ncbi:MAG: deoxyribodipyrimidine photo-lyase [Bacteroidota bacterium]